MARLNVGISSTPIKTYEGATAVRLTPKSQLRRMVMANLLWEKQFYIDGKDCADLIAAVVPACDPTDVMKMAIEARTEQNLRHVPLLLAREMARHEKSRKFVASTLEAIIQRPDELSEFFLMYDSKYGRDQRGKGQPLAAQVKKGLARAFTKFSEYQLAKYDRDGLVRLKDVLFFAHAKPKDGVAGRNKAWRKPLVKGEIYPVVDEIGAKKVNSEESPAFKLSESELLYQRLIAGTLATPDTWEVSLSKLGEKPGQTEKEKLAAKKEAWTRLLTEGKLGGLALLRNLRNMRDAGLDKQMVAGALLGGNYSRVLPFRFIAAARAVPEWEDVIEPAMLKAVGSVPKLAGHTVVIVDVSGSMDSQLSDKSDMTRIDAACGVAVLARELCEQATVIAFSNNAEAVPARRGFALRDAIATSMHHGGTDTASAIKLANKMGYGARMILVTDEQSHTSYPDPLPDRKAYVINVGAYQNGLGYGRYIHIDGFSEAIFKFMSAVEKEDVAA